MRRKQYRASIMSQFGIALDGKGLFVVEHGPWMTNARAALAEAKREAEDKNFTRIELECQIATHDWSDCSSDTTEYELRMPGTGAVAPRGTPREKLQWFNLSK